MASLWGIAGVKRSFSSCKMVISVISYQLSVISYQLSVISDYQQSLVAFNFHSLARGDLLPLVFGHISRWVELNIR
ncbi:hypothetical protein MICAH_2710003 [Microcystis aeruginosa PCC 9809]|uniref:Uncharacterized protein n=1 Tax=Microcystis aeruginosa PCC 9809 TaxID=1160285 RepID=I4HPQ0_MICAE|nr:hypothetical protein MICAH_2710003 [Microcystis aeruginosa PCC 9809]